MKRHVLLAGLSLVLTACVHRRSAPDGYAPRVALALAQGPDRMDGRMILLEDARIRDDMRTAIAQAYGDNPCTPDAPAVLAPLCSSTRDQPLRPALLELRDAEGRTLATRTAERPLADLVVAHLYGSPRNTYLFTVDLSAEAGSYSGPYTRLAEPDAKGFGWLTADSSGVADTITLVSTLKTAWREVPRVDGRGDDLLMVQCRPDFTTSDTTGVARFVLTYKRFSFDGRHWTLRERQAPGCYESDEPFPAPADFP